jgi:hypothetical protein
VPDLAAGTRDQRNGGAHETHYGSSILATDGAPESYRTVTGFASLQFS